MLKQLFVLFTLACCTQAFAEEKPAVIIEETVEETVKESTKLAVADIEEETTEEEILPEAGAQPKCC